MMASTASWLRRPATTPGDDLSCRRLDEVVHLLLLDGWRLDSVRRLDGGDDEESDAALLDEVNREYVFRRPGTAGQ